MADKLNFKPANRIYDKITDGTHDSPKRKETGKPLITSKHIKGRNIDFTTAYLISEEDFEKINKRSQVNKWDVIISMIGEYCGYCYIERNDDIDYAIKNVGLYKTESKLEAEWLFYYLNSPLGKAYLNSVKSGSSQPYLTLGGLRKLPILVPEKQEQKIRITKVLSDLDAKIEINNKINAELEAMAKLLYDYWFVQFDFPDENGQPYKSSGGQMVYNERLKREIPEGWEVKQLEEVLTVVRGASPRPIKDFIANEGLPWIKISDATKSENRFIIETKQFIRKEGESKTRVLQPNALILSNSASPAIPRIVRLRSGIHDGWLLIKDFKYSLSKEFLYHYFTYERPRIINLGSGSIFKNLKTDYVKGLKIVVPPEELLLEVNKKFHSISEKIYFCTIENQKLSELRDWLLPMLMNGQVKVRG